MATQMERALQAMGFLEKGLITWDKGLRQFLENVSQQHGTLNHQWNDTRQQMYHKSWTKFESDIGQSNKLAAEVHASFTELMKYMAIYLKRPVSTSQAFGHLKKVRKLSGWPASASSPIQLHQLVAYLEKYAKILEDFYNQIKKYVKDIMGPLQQIHQMVRSPKIDGVGEQVKLRAIAWIEETGKSIKDLQDTVKTIIKDLKPLI